MEATNTKSSGPPGPKAVVTRKYETMVLIAASATEDSVEGIVKDTRDTLGSRGATISLIERWGRRRTAYPIRNNNEAWYVLLHVDGNGDALQEAERKLRLNENVLRYLTVRIDDVAGAEQSAKDRLVRKAKQEEERAVRAAERAARDEADATRRVDSDVPDDGDDSDDDLD